jgi:hypothetical protein
MVVCVLLVALLFYPGIEGNFGGRTVIALFVFPVAIIVLAWIVKVRIEYFLHYQRLREIFYVLETSYIAFRDHPEVLDPPFSEFAKSCSQDRNSVEPRA